MQKRILIAEDDQVTRKLMTSYAKMQGYDVNSVTNGVDLLTVMAFESFDAVITDLLMKDLNGASAAEILKMQGNTTPVIALTGVSPEDTIIVKDYFTKIYHKPVDIIALFKFVESII